MFSISSWASTGRSRIARLALLLGALVLIGVARPVIADQLAFGSFRSATNASNWAQKLGTILGEPMQVQHTAATANGLHRVLSSHLTETRLQQLSRRAQQAGIEHWRVRGAPPARNDPSDTDSTKNPQSVVEAITQPAPETRPLPRASAPNPRSEPIADDTRPDSQVAANLFDGEMQWDLGLQTRIFPERGVFGQNRFEGSVSVEFEYFKGWDGDSRSITFNPFFRYDSADDERTHGDIRDLYFSQVGETWDVHLGVKRVFWGVTEFHHLVDIINQTDLVENVDTEDKLGQPMAQLSLVRDWGILDIYALAGFRERTFPGSAGRVRLPLRVLEDPRYESGARDKRVDGAIRWSNHFGPVELGLHHFSGTSRDPMFDVLPDGQGSAVVRPYYPVIDQTGIDAQAFYGDWAFKLEGISRSGYGERYAAANLGFERTVVGAFGSRADLGLVMEYMFDERGDEASNTFFENDLALGGRWQLNDFADTQALVGLILDMDTDDYFFSVEASRRLSDGWTMSLEGRLFGGGENFSSNTPLASMLSRDYKTSWLQRDDYLQLEFKRFL